MPFADKQSRDIIDTVVNIDSTDCCWLSSDALPDPQSFLRQRVLLSTWMVTAREAPTSPSQPHTQPRQLTGPPGSPVPSPGELGAVFK